MFYKSARSESSSQRSVSLSSWSFKFCCWLKSSFNLKESVANSDKPFSISARRFSVSAMRVFEHFKFAPFFERKFFRRSPIERSDFSSFNIFRFPSEVRGFVSFASALFTFRDFQICRIIAGKFADFARVFKFENRVNRAVEKISVVADDDQRAREIVEIFFERDQGRNVEIVGRFVEKQDVRFVHQNFQKI